jgi:predicted RNA-binding Zn-ribbon protein involved in translation (DUF1610 family)
MLDIKGQENLSKYKKNKQISIKETNTLDNKHRQMVKYFNNNKYEKEKLLKQINNINSEIKKIDDRRDTFKINESVNNSSLGKTQRVFSNLAEETQKVSSGSLSILPKGKLISSILDFESKDSKLEGSLHSKAVQGSSTSNACGGSLGKTQRVFSNLAEETQKVSSGSSSITYNDIKTRALLLSEKTNLEMKYNEINIDEMDYYDNAGDLISDYYEMRDKVEPVAKESKNILEFLCNKKDKQIINNEIKIVNKANLFEKYCQRIDGIRIIKDNGSNRIKYCIECNIEKILDMSESAYICPCCGDSEMIILDEDRQIKDYSPYKRLNHFREWLNQFQAKQSPDIPEQLFIDIVKELNKNRITDLSILNKKKMKIILKKLNYNNFYEHVTYIINKLNNLPPPKITRDMEKLFISMFYKTQEPWEMFKSSKRKNFLSYSYVLHKFCELLELDHLYECFPLHKDPDKIMENDQIWEKICKYLKWEYISSFK